MCSIDNTTWEVGPYSSVTPTENTVVAKGLKIKTITEYFILYKLSKYFIFISFEVRKKYDKQTHKIVPYLL